VLLGGGLGGRECFLVGSASWGALGGERELLSKQRFLWRPWGGERRLLSKQRFLGRPWGKKEGFSVGSAGEKEGFLVSSASWGGPGERKRAS